MKLSLDAKGAPMVMLADVHPNQKKKTTSARPAPPPAPKLPADREILTLAQAAAAIGTHPDRAAELLGLHSVPRIVGWARRDVEDLARLLRPEESSDDPADAEADA